MGYDDQTECLCVCDHVCIHTLKGKWLELSKCKLIQMQSMADAGSAKKMISMSKGQRSGAHDYEKGYCCTSCGKYATVKVVREVRCCCQHGTAC